MSPYENLLAIGRNAAHWSLYWLLNGAGTNADGFALEYALLSAEAALRVIAHEAVNA